MYKQISVTKIQTYTSCGDLSRGFSIAAQTVGRQRFFVGPGSFKRIGGGIIFASNAFGRVLRRFSKFFGQCQVISWGGHRGPKLFAGYAWHHKRCRSIDCGLELRSKEINEFEPTPQEPFRR